MPNDPIFEEKLKKVRKPGCPLRKTDKSKMAACWGKNWGSGGIEKSHSCKWAKWIQWHALPHIQQSTQQRNKGHNPNLHGWDFSIPPSPKLGYLTFWAILDSIFWQRVCCYIISMPRNSFFEVSVNFNFRFLRNCLFLFKNGCEGAFQFYAKIVTWNLFQRMWY